MTVPLLIGELHEIIGVLSRVKANDGLRDKDRIARMMAMPGVMNVIMDGLSAANAKFAIETAKHYDAIRAADAKRTKAVDALVAGLPPLPEPHDEAR